MTPYSLPARTVRAARTVPWPLLLAAAVLGLLAAAGGRRGSRPGASDALPSPNAQEEGAPFGEPKPLASRGESMARASENGRGRRARTPTEIPAQGWKDILWRTYEAMGRDRLMAVAAGVVFYALLAIFPAVTALVSLYGLIFDPLTVLGHLQTLGAMLPPGAFEIVEDQVNRVVTAGGGGLTVSFIVGLGVALWSAMAGVKAIFDALNVIYGEDEKRSFVRLNLVALAFTLGAIGLFFLFVATVVVLPLVLAAVGYGGQIDSYLPMLRWPVVLLVLLAGLAVLYRYGPSRTVAQWRWLGVGSLFAGATWIAASLLFSWYLQNFGDYNAVYGSLGAVIGLMMWMWLSAIVVLLGAEINAQTEHQTVRDTTVGRRKPLGRRGAAMADSVGEAT